MSLVIRPALPAEAEEIARIINAAFEIERDFRAGERTTTDQIRELIGRDTVLVADDSGRLLGAIEVRVDGATGYFGMLAVETSARRRGLGRTLVEAAEGYCRRAGCSSMTMSTGEDRTELIPYYSKMGYRVTAIEPSVSRAFRKPIRVVHMTKPL